MTSSGRTDEQIIAALAQRDLSALEELYERYSKVAYSLAYRIVGDRGSAEDVVQDAFLSVWRQAQTYKPERGKARTWLMSIVHHRSIDRLRSGASANNTIPYDDLPESEDDTKPSIWQQAWTHLRGDVVRRALDRLPAEQKKSIELAYFSGYTQTEIAELMGVPLGTVKGRMRIGLQKLRAMLDGLEIGASST
ncbi:MAG: sigma-70 family RNA polymerase sigma factor [Candidatus Eremiobacteraeota bacterium]|nr:sigma-70 family RNA polymerase sigma factor [Candidatus Eremiobacteraeota bacterium]MBV8668737.1 sigma-70 family RNA polymerase sigma factor [Candidatus Eremiobacteraeota bacterium]